MNVDPPTTFAGGNTSKVMLIVDDPVAARNYSSEFRLGGFHITHVSNAQGAFTTADGFQPDAIVFELTPACLSGIDVVRQLHEDSRFAHVPIVVCARACSPASMEKARAAGATAILSNEEISPRKIVETVRRLLQKSIPLSHRTFPHSMGSEQFRSQLLQHFVTSAPERIAEMRRELERLVGRRSDVQLKHLFALRDQLHRFSSNAAMSGVTNVFHTSRIIEALLMDFCGDPEKISPSRLHTLAEGVDFLAFQLQHTLNPKAEDISGGAVLILSEEESTREVAAFGIEQAGLRPFSCNDAIQATDLVEKNHFDLCIVDFDLAGNGLAFCRKLREEFQQDRPIIALVDSINLETRTNLMFAKGTDLLSKPFPATEIGLKAWMHFVRFKLFADVRNEMMAATAPPSERGQPCPSEWNDHADSSADKAVRAPALHIESQTAALRRSLQESPKGIANALTHSDGLKIKRILVPIDFSDCSKKALLYAVEFAKEYHARLDVLYVAPPFTGHDPYDLAVGERVEQERREEGQRKLAELVEQEIPREIVTETFVRNGRAVTEIIDKAKELGSELIIISTHGYRGISEALQGSTTEGVVRQAPCPILVVREREHEFLLS